MPRNMTVKWPNAWVVGVILHNEVTKGRHQLDVTALGVLDMCDLAVPSPRADGEDIEIVAV